MIAPIINIKTITKNVIRAFFIRKISNLNTTIMINLFHPHVSFTPNEHI